MRSKLSYLGQWYMKSIHFRSKWNILVQKHCVCFSFILKLLLCFCLTTVFQIYFVELCIKKIKKNQLLFTSAFSGVGMSPSAWCEAWKPAAARWCFWRTCWMKLEPGCCTTWASQKVKRSGGDKRPRFLARTLLCETRAPVTWIFWSFFSNEGPGRPGGHSGDGGSQCTDGPGEPAFSSRVF